MDNDALEDTDDQFARQLEAIHDQVLTASSGLERDSFASAARLFRMIERARKGNVDDTARVRAHDTTLPQSGTADIGTTSLVFTDLSHGRHLGRFSIDRKLGEGGYGFVFLARDEALDRLVALKVPRPEAVLTEEMRARFIREGKAAALLSHPSIVPVFETGHVGPVCFLVSQYVDGITLADWLAKQPNGCKPNAAADLVAHLAEAVQHAHQKGVIHRDLKPANVLLEGIAVEHAEEEAALGPAARITDFGLAKTASDQNLLTGTGAILGTPAYMATEQALAQSSGPGVDVYALGAILYELLTGVPPFVGDSVLETLRLVQEREPSRAYFQQAATPRELEAICLKCLEKSPDARYVSAAELETDLQRFLRGEPVTAAPAGPLRQLAKWCRRKPGAAALSVTAAGLLIATTAATSIGWFATTGALRRESTARADAETAKASAAQRYEEVKATVDEYLTKVSENQLLAAPGMKSLRGELLTSALKYYERLQQDQTDDHDLPVEIERTHFRIGRIHDELGTHDKALEQYATALKLHRKLPDHDAIDERLHHAELLRRMAGIRQSFGEMPIALQQLDAAIDLVGDPDQTTDDGRIQLANTLMHKGSLLKQLGRESKAEESLRWAVVLWKALVETDNGNPRMMFQLAETEARLGSVLFQIGKTEEGRAIMEASIDRCRRLVAQDPGALNYQNNLAAALGDLGRRDFAAHHFEQALVLTEESASLFDRLSMIEPTVDKYRLNRSSARNQLAIAHERLGHSDEALDAMHTATRTLEELAMRNPDRTDYQEGLAAQFLNLSAFYSKREHYDLAIVELMKAMEAFDHARTVTPDSLHVRIGQAMCRLNLGVMHGEQDEQEQCLVHLNFAIASIEEILAERPESPRIQSLLSSALRARGAQYDKLERYDAAVSDFDHCFKLVAPTQRDAVLLDKALTLAHSGRFDEAIQTAEVARELIDERPNVWAHFGRTYAAIAAKHPEYVAQSLDALEKAAALGYFEDPTHIQWLTDEPDFASLNEEARLQKLLAIRPNPEPQSPAP